jgi:DUF3054 family protein
MIAVGTVLVTLPPVSFAGSNRPQAGQNPSDPAATSPPGDPAAPAPRRDDRLPLRSPDPVLVGAPPWLGAGSAGALAAVVAADLAVAVLYVVVGRLSHDEGIGAGGLLHTGWPFLAGLLGGYVGVALTRWPPMCLRAGLVVSIKMVIIGLVLRYGVARDDVPLSYAVVTAVVLIGLTSAWRAVAARGRRREATD